MLLVSVRLPLDHMGAAGSGFGGKRKPALFTGHCHHQQDGVWPVATTSKGRGCAVAQQLVLCKDCSAEQVSVKLDVAFSHWMVLLASALLSSAHAGRAA